MKSQKAVKVAFAKIAPAKKVVTQRKYALRKAQKLGKINY
jgi:hypothetical protein